MAGLYHYFVEGECEEALLKALMHSSECEYDICLGKIEVLNVIYQKISRSKALTLKKGTTVVFAFDTDIPKTDVLKENIETITNVTYKEVIFVQSCKTLEDELVYSCEGINNIDKLLNTNGKDDFKKKFIKHKDIVSKLMSVGFKPERLWSRTPPKAFSSFKQGINRIFKKRHCD